MEVLTIIRNLIDRYSGLLVLVYLAILSIATILYIGCLLKREDKKRESTTEVSKEKTKKYKASINGNKIIFGAKGISPMATHVLALLAAKCDVYVITQVKSDEEEKAAGMCFILFLVVVFFCF